MAGSDDILGAARDAFEDAHRNLDHDLADADTAPLARAVRDNHDDALANYLKAIRTAFTLADADWQQALADARSAQAAVAAARAAAQALATRLRDLTALTKAITDLIGAAK